MRRRSQKTQSVDPAPEIVVLPDDGETTPVDDSGPWEDWGESESERVARWLQSKVRPEIDVVEDDEPDVFPEYRTVAPDDATTRPLHAESRYEADMWRLDQQRRRVTIEVEAERAQAERARREQLDAWARLESEMTNLDEKRRRLADAVDAERAEVERVRREQSEAASRLETAMAELDQHRQRLMAVQAEKSEAERVHQEQVEARAALRAEVDAIDEQRRRLMAAVDAERSEAERARRAHADARARLESEMAELDHQRRRLVEAVEAERGDVERARTEQLDAKARLSAEVAALDRERQALLAAMEADRAEAARVAAERAAAAQAAAEQAAAADAETVRAELARAEAELAVAAAERAAADLAVASEQAAAARQAAAERVEADRLAAERSAAADAAAAEVAAATEALTTAQAQPPDQDQPAAAPARWGDDDGADDPPSGPGGDTGTIDLTSRRAAAASRGVGPAGGRRMRLVPGTGEVPAAQVTTVETAQTPEEQQAEAKARLAAAVAELARHVATTQADERIDAELFEQQQRDEEARRRAEEEAAAAQRRRSADALEAARATVDGRTRRWVLRAAVILAVLIPIGLDVRSPMATRSRLSDIANAAVASAATQMSDVNDPALAARVAQGVADIEGVKLERFSIEGTVVHVTVRDEADSIVLGRLVPGWYEIKASAMANALIDSTR